ncbi:Putative amino-acid ABC transporter-binding protein YhdW [Seminavis robusta]|uniref:Amino-acid ABC transporter-binding protein YhdW n=1 Tax=Seminavis robusta TaxID=568900 RepID=A0A9N8E8X9_9STRA|nr:Putative amino-acid ABC transporter-binding protein YhdW [Seminavis robusta]|eukprot:Sro786_g202260.1 Putative amino-acid ABC transporter-binding protein YhdW (770) ;mRNA; r:18880-21333
MHTLSNVNGLQGQTATTGTTNNTGRPRVTSHPGAYALAPSGGGISSSIAPNNLQASTNTSNPLGRGDEQLLTIEAVPVVDEHRTEQEIENEVRQRIFNEAVQADAVIPVPMAPEDLETGTPADHSQDNRSKQQQDSTTRANRALWIGVAILLLIAVLAVALALGLSNRDSGNQTESQQQQQQRPTLVEGNSPSTLASANSANDTNTSSTSTVVVETQPDLSKPTLQRVKERGYVKCGIYVDQPGFGLLDPATGNYSGFNFQLCRAVAAAVFDGNGDRYQITTADTANRFQFIASGELDVISQSTTITMERDLADVSTKLGVSFSYPFYFSGMMFGGTRQDYVECADKLDPFHGVCRGLKVCVAIGTTQEAMIDELLPGPVAVRYANPRDAVVYMKDGRCNVVAAEPVLLNPSRVNNYLGLFHNQTFRLGNNTFSRDPLALFTRDGDVEWSDIVNSVMKILFTGEARNITKANVQEYNFDDAKVPIALQERIQNVISTVGNLGELYRAETAEALPRQGINTLNQDLDKGLMYSYPFGIPDRIQPEEIPRISETMSRIQEAGRLRCGITARQRGFAWRNNSTAGRWSGLHVEVCHGLTAALFAGDTSRIEFVTVGHSHRFQALKDGHVDVLAGEPISLTNEFFEPSTGMSYAFSMPYFYNNNHATDINTTQSMMALATNRTDEVWSSFAFWTINALIYAEENNITSSNAIEMPTVNLFGVAYVQALRDCISAVGNYGDLYEQTLGSIIPRSGGNLLNQRPFGSQQVAYPLF